jgi:hypothetical protein
MDSYVNSTQYFYPESDRTPNVLEYILLNVLTYFSKRLFFNEYEMNPQKAMGRFILGRGSGETDTNVAIERFQQMINVLPYVVYTIDDMSIGDYRNFPMLQGWMYLEDIDRNAIFWQEKLTLGFYAFFNTNRDFLTARSLILHESYDVFTIYVPVPINKITDQYSKKSDVKYMMLPVYITISDVVKGDFTYEYQKWLNRHRIYDFSFKCELKYINFYFTEQKWIYPVKSAVVDSYDSKEIEVERIEKEFSNEVEVEIKEQITEYIIPYDVGTLEVRFPSNLLLDVQNTQVNIYPNVNFNYEIDTFTNSVKITLNQGLERNKEYLIKFIINGQEMLFYVKTTSIA